MAGQEINIRLSLKDDLSVNLKGVTKTLEGVGNAGQAAGNKTQVSFKGVISQAKAMITPFRQVGFIVSATFGAVAVSMQDLASKISAVEENAARLGTTAESLSKKMYGVNITSDEAKIGTAAWSNAIRDLGNAVMWVQTKFAEWQGSMVKQGAQQDIYAAKLANLKPGDVPNDKAGAEAFYKKLYEDSGKVATDSLLEVSRAQKAASEETVKLAAQTSDEIKRITLSDRKYKEYQLDQTIASYRRAGMEEKLIAEYTKVQKATLEAEKTNEINKNVAARLKLENQTTKAFEIEQGIQLANYVKVWGQDGEAMTAFRRLQDAQLKEVQFNSSIIGQTMKSVGSAMTNSLGAAFADAVTGFKNMKEIAKDFGNTLINIIMTAIARLILMKTIGEALAPMTGGASLTMFHQGGVVRKAHTGMRLGNDEVPIVAQAGEGIISRKGMRSLGAENFNRINRGEGSGGGATIIVHQPIQAWDAADVYRNRKTLSAGIIEELRRNGDFRGAVRQYK